MIAVHLVCLAIAAVGVQSDSSDVHSQPHRLVLYAVDATFNWRVDPIVVFEGDQWVNPIKADGDPSVVWRAYYGTSPAVTILSRNEVVGRGTLTAAPEPDCFDMFGLLATADTSKVEPNWIGLASTDPRIGGDPLGRIATEKETETLLEHARGLARDNGIADSLAGAVTPFGPILALTDSAGAAEILVGGFRLLTWIIDSEGWEIDRQISVFSMRRNDGTLVFDWFRDELGTQVGSMSAVDVVDIGRDGYRELIVRSAGYEGWGYEVYTEESNWRLAYDGGGGGC